MFWNSYLVKTHKIANNSATTEAREKSTDLESLEVQKYFDVRLTKFENHNILHNKISNIFLVTTKPLCGWKRIILNILIFIQAFIFVHTQASFNEWKKHVADASFTDRLWQPTQITFENR